MKRLVKLEAKVLATFAVAVLVVFVLSAMTWMASRAETTSDGR